MQVKPLLLPIKIFAVYMQKNLFCRLRKIDMRFSTLHALNNHQSLNLLCFVVFEKLSLLNLPSKKVVGFFDNHEWFLVTICINPKETAFKI